MSCCLAFREELREKVAQLQALVTRLLPASITEKLSDAQSNTPDDTEQSSEINKEVSGATESYRSLSIRVSELHFNVHREIPGGENIRNHRNMKEPRNFRS